MKKFGLTPRAKNVLVAAHILCMVAWFGGTLCLLTLNIVAANATDLNQLVVTDLNLNVIDDRFIKFPALGTLITGLALTMLTNWGLVNYYWIIVKEILTVALIAFGIFGMNRWSSEATLLISKFGWDALGMSAYAFDRAMVLNGALANSLVMAGIVLISYLKPWGRRKPARSDHLS